MMSIFNKKLSVLFSLILSFFIILPLSSCSKKRKRSGEEILRIGSNFSLFSLNQYSINSLNDSFIYKLLYDQVFVLEKSFIKSKFLKEIKLKDKNLSFNIIADDSFFKDLEKAYKEGLESNLWSLHFKKFKLSRDKLINLGEGSLEDLKIISSLWMLKGEEYGRYKVKELIKNQRLVLKSRDDEKRRVLKLYRVKSVAQGLSALNSKKMDIYFNKSLIDSDLLSGGKLLNFREAKDKFVFLRIYKIMNHPNYLKKTFNKVMPQIRKVINKDFIIEDEELENLKEEQSLVAYKDLNILFNNDLSQKILDVLAPEYKTLSGKEIFYEKMSNQKIADKLSKGEFDFYFSLDIENLNKKTVYYSATHSKGKYNSFKLKDVRLDQVLEKKRSSWDLLERKALDLEAQEIVKSLNHKVLEWRAPFYDVVYNKDLSLKGVEKKFNLDFN